MNSIFKAIEKSEDFKKYQESKEPELIHKKTNNFEDQLRLTEIASNAEMRILMSQISKLYKVHELEELRQNDKVYRMMTKLRNLRK